MLPPSGTYLPHLDAKFVLSSATLPRTPVARDGEISKAPTPKRVTGRFKIANARRVTGRHGTPHRRGRTALSTENCGKHLSGAIGEMSQAECLKGGKHEQSLNQTVLQVMAGTRRLQPQSYPGLLAAGGDERSTQIGSDLTSRFNRTSIALANFWTASRCIARFLASSSGIDDTPRPGSRTDWPSF